MGIQGLLPLFKSIHSNIHIKEYAGKTVAVDAYVWLHKGAFACAFDLAQNKPTTKYVDYCVNRIRMLKFFNVIPLIVFDGGYLPSKAGTEAEREERRKENRIKGIALLREGKKKQAVEFFQKCVDVTPEMAFQFIKALRAENIQYVVAPYEADAQLAYLLRTGKASAVVTEDSDLLVFGCERVIFKLDAYGAGVEVLRDRFAAVKEVSLVGWTDDQLRQMCILSGCDYLPSIPGMGLKTAHKLLRKYKTAEKVIKFVRMEGQMRVPPDYEQAFQRAELTFQYQRVYDIDTCTLTTLTPVPEGMDVGKMDFLGPELDLETARRIAMGDLNPITKQPIVDLSAGVLEDKENRERKPTLPLQRNRKPFQPSTTTNAMPIVSYFKPVISTSLSNQVSNIFKDTGGDSKSTVRGVMKELELNPSQDSCPTPPFPAQKRHLPESIFSTSLMNLPKRRASDTNVFRHRPADTSRPVNVFSRLQRRPVSDSSLVVGTPTSTGATIATEKVTEKLTEKKKEKLTEEVTVSRFFSGCHGAGGGGRQSVEAPTALRSSLGVVDRDYDEGVRLSLESFRSEVVRFAERKREGDGKENRDEEGGQEKIEEEGVSRIMGLSHNAGSESEWREDWDSQDDIEAKEGYKTEAKAKVRDDVLVKTEVNIDLGIEVTTEVIPVSPVTVASLDGWEALRNVPGVRKDPTILRERTGRRVEEEHSWAMDNKTAEAKEEAHQKIAMGWRRRWGRKEGRMENEERHDKGAKENLLLVGKIPPYQFNNTAVEDQAGEDFDHDLPAAPETSMRQLFTFEASTSALATVSPSNIGNCAPRSGAVQIPARAKALGLTGPAKGTVRRRSPKGKKVDIERDSVTTSIRAALDQYRYQAKSP